MKTKHTVKSRLSLLQEIYVLYYGIRDPGTALHAKLVALAALIYLISPIDLIPDFIPVAGYLDDLVIVPLLLHVAFTLLPVKVKQAGWAEAKNHLVKLRIIFAILLVFLLGIMVSLFFLLKWLFS